jgi:chemotaxis protein MotB
VKPGDEDTNARELVLIRRRGPVDDAPHKGGVWKIAYADFMTAMMAFFLVMWLINSTDQRVLTQVANYFNPMRLTDNTPHERGLNNMESGEQGKQGKQSSVGDPKEKHHANETVQETKADKKNAAPMGEGAEGSKGQTARYSEQALFSDPFGVLARIAAEAPKEIVAPSDKAGAGTPFRDPFDGAGQRQLKSERTKQAGAGDGAPSASEADRQQQAAASPATGPTERDRGTAEQKTVAQSLSQAPTLAQQPPAVQSKEQDEARKIEQDIKQLAAQLKGGVPSINVTASDEGVLISVTDDYDFGMFAIASAEPRPALVAVMDRIAKIVRDYPHPVTIRGHTDGRRYRAGTSDNWRLSTARAQMAYYMLVRGGVDEKRFDRIEGHADRSLRVPNDADAAQNRRIEILLRRPKP